MAQPTIYPEIADHDDANMAEPDTSVKEHGWADGAEPTAKHFNYPLHWITKWLKWLGGLNLEHALEILTELVIEYTATANAVTGLTNAGLLPTSTNYNVQLVSSDAGSTPVAFTLNCYRHSGMAFWSWPTVTMEVDELCSLWIEPVASANWPTDVLDMSNTTLPDRTRYAIVALQDVNSTLHEVPGCIASIDTNLFSDEGSKMIIFNTRRYATDDQILMDAGSFPAGTVGIRAGGFIHRLR
jgi:hypothetical protein